MHKRGNLPWLLIVYTVPFASYMEVAEVLQRKSCVSRGLVTYACVCSVLAEPERGSEWYALRASHIGKRSLSLGKCERASDDENCIVGSSPPSPTAVVSCHDAIRGGWTCKWRWSFAREDRGGSRGWDLKWNFHVSQYHLTPRIPLGCLRSRERDRRVVA